MAIKFLNTVAVDTNVLYVDAINNRVGIGTNNPDARLSVSDDGQAVFEITPFTNDYGTTLRSYDTVDDNFNYLSYKASIHRFHIGDAEKMRINSSGNVGIGTTSPAELLNVNKENAESVVLISRGGTNPATSTDIGKIKFASDYSNVVTEYGHIKTYANNLSAVRGSMDFSVKSTSGTVLTGMTLHGTSAGVNVGIGTIYPVQAKLVVSGNVAFNQGDETMGQINPEFERLDFKVNDGVVSATPVAMTLRDYSDGARLGIGTINPSAKLEIEGDATSNDTAQLVVASGGVDNNSIIHFTDDAGGQVNAIGALEGNMLTLASQNELVFKTGTSSILGSANTKMTILTNGNVGIGTASPSHLLTLENANSPGLKIKDTTQGATLLAFSQDSNSHIGTYSSHPLILDTNSTERMRIDTNGNVGIGTTTPYGKLDVAGNIRLQSANQIYFGGTGSIPYWTTGVDNTTNNNFEIAGNSYYSGDRDILLTPVNNGNVGIGATDPYFDLDVAGDIRIRDQESLFFGTSGSIPSLSINCNSSGDMVIDDVYTNSADVLFNINGNIGMGNTAPAAKLDIVNTSSTSSSGLLKLKSTTVFSSAPGHMIDFIRSNNTIRGFIGMNQYGVTYSTSSDYRLKRNIVPIADSIDRIKKLKPSRFNWDDGPDDYVVDGFIAHEVADVIPEAITGEKDDVDKDNAPIYQSIDQSKIVPLLTAALQEAVARIEALELRINKLEKQ